jgi:hypothetical protein
MRTAPATMPGADEIAPKKRATDAPFGPQMSNTTASSAAPNVIPTIRDMIIKPAPAPEAKPIAGFFKTTSKQS